MDGHEESKKSPHVRMIQHQCLAVYFDMTGCKQIEKAMNTSGTFICCFRINGILHMRYEYDL